MTNLVNKYSIEVFEAMKHVKLCNTKSEHKLTEDYLELLDIWYSGHIGSIYP